MINTSLDASFGEGVRNGEEDPAQAMASLLASSNPFLGEFCTSPISAFSLLCLRFESDPICESTDATQPTLSSNVFNDDFGLTGSNGVAGVGELNSDWTTFGDLGGMTGTSWMGL